AHRGERLVAELGAEPGSHFVVRAERLALVPDAPIVHVAPAVIVPVVGIVAASCGGRAGPEDAGRVALVYHPADDPLVQPVVVHDIAVAVLPRLRKPGERSHVLVVAAPQGDGGMVAEA